MPSSPIFAITGQLAAGKSTLARAILDRFAFGYHVDVDALRELVTTGLASPLAWTDETTRQFDLALQAATARAGVYHRAGFAVAIDGALDPLALDRHLADAGLGDAVVGVVLHPPLAVALERNRGRVTKAFDPSILEGAMHDIDSDLHAEPLPDGWVRHDNGAETLDDTVRWLAELGATRIG
jgi:adenylylsulfate kinase-like enzyme